MPRKKSKRKRKKRTSKRNNKSIWFLLSASILAIVYAVNVWLGRKQQSPQLKELTEQIETVAEEITETSTEITAETNDNEAEDRIEEKSQKANQHPTRKNSNTEITEELFLKAIPKTPTPVQIVKHKTYTAGYSEKHEQSLWVQYELTKWQVEHKRVERYKKFMEDPEVSTSSATSWDYSHSGFDRGHLLPSADRRYSQEAQEETFYMSNISPQYHNFNAKIWNNLEMKVRDWARKERKVLVITGPAFLKKTKKIGRENKIDVPSHFYKIIIDLTPPYKSMAFLIPHTNKSETKFWKYKTTIDEIEMKTGIDFLSDLPDSLENELESKTYWWK